VKKEGAVMAGRKQKITLGIALAAAILAAFVAVADCGALICVGPGTQAH